MVELVQHSQLSIVWPPMRRMKSLYRLRNLRYTPFWFIVEELVLLGPVFDLLLILGCERRFFWLKKLLN
jgi:hypothetical protein